MYPYKITESGCAILKVCSCGLEQSCCIVGENTLDVPISGDSSLAGIYLSSGDTGLVSALVVKMKWPSSQSLAQELSCATCLKYVLARLRRVAKQGCLDFSDSYRNSLLIKSNFMIEEVLETTYYASQCTNCPVSVLNDVRMLL